MNTVNYQGQLLQPSKLVCIGKNYMAHIEEMSSAIPDEPVLFIKPNSAISTDITLKGDEDIHYEGEISLLIIAGEISGIGFGLDLTKRDMQWKLKEQGLPWERSKAFDGSAQFSEFIPFNESTESLSLELTINGELKQKGSYELMLNKPEATLIEIKGVFTLEDGDIIMTGTPSGVGKLAAGDVLIGKVFKGEEVLVEHSWTVK